VTRRESLRLGDIREAIATIERYLREATFDEKTGDAVLYNLVVIGEAANALSEETQKMEPAVPWSEIVGLRNLIAHEYSASTARSSNRSCAKSSRDSTRLQRD
jgi:uncharacterized protein with HEPN domain